MAGGDSYEASFELSGRDGVEDCTINFWVKGAKQSILQENYCFYRYELKIEEKDGPSGQVSKRTRILAIARRW